MLSAHNAYRSQHQVGPLGQSDSIDGTAQEWAQYLADNNIFKHSGAAGLGENLAMSGTFETPSVDQCSG